MIVTEVAIEVVVRVVLIGLVEVAIEVVCGRLWLSLTAFEVIIGAVTEVVWGRHRVVIW